MSVRFMDGCEHYAGADILFKYDGLLAPMTIRTGAGRISGNCLGAATSFGGFVSKQLVTSTERTHIVGFACQIDNYTTTDDDSIAWARGATGSQTTWTLTTDNAGVLNLYMSGAVSAPAGTLVATSASNTMTAAVYHFIEVELFVDDTAGFIKLYVDGVNVAEQTGFDTDALVSDSVNPVDEIGFQQPSTWACRFDDIHVIDSSGSTNNTRVGDTQVATIYPTANGSTNQFTPLSGTNFGSVNEAQGDGDTSFVESGTIGQKDLYTVGGLVATTVFAVQPLSLVRKTTTETLTGSVIANDGVSDFTAATLSLSTDYKYVHGVFQTDPSDSSAWNQDKVNGTEFGVKLVS